ncbi:MAG: PIN domain-containing protein [Melioribacteraceae bacterium]
MENVVYLDTHVIVWLYSGNLDLIPLPIQSILNKSILLISPFVKLELEYLYEIKRIKQKSNKIISILKSEIGLNICDIEFTSIIEKAITTKWTRDPFDRIIVAQASLKKSTLVTKDETILKNYKNAIWSVK